MPARLLALLVALAVALPPAWAGPEEARALFDQGNRAYRKRQYRQALDLYRRSFAEAERPSVLFNIARTEERLGELAAAHRDFTRFLAMAAPDDPRRRDAERSAAELRARLVPLAVTTAPPGAEVIIDGGEPAPAPVEALVAPGRHRIAVRAAGAAAEQEVTAALGAPLRIALVRVDITAEPADATIRPPAGAPVTGRYVALLPPGSHRITVERGQRVKVLELEVTAGEPMERVIELEERAAAPAPPPKEPPPAGPTRLVVEGTPGATVSLDAVPLGSIPLERVVEPGAHQLTVERAGYRAWQGTVAVAAGAETHVAVALADAPSGAARAAMWGLAGAGVAGLAAGGAFGLLALGDERSYQDLPSKDLGDRADRRALAADLLIGGGAAAVVGALLLRSRASARESRAVITSR